MSCAKLDTLLCFLGSCRCNVIKGIGYEKTKMTATSDSRLSIFTQDVTVCVWGFVLVKGLAACLRFDSSCNRN